MTMDANPFFDDEAFDDEAMVGGEADPSTKTCRNAPGTTADCNCASGFACPIYDITTVEKMWVLE